MRAVAGPRRWVAVLILAVLAVGALVVVTRLLGPDAAQLRGLSARLPFVTAGTVLSPVLSGLLGIGGGLLAARNPRWTDRRLRTLVLAGIVACLMWLALVSAFWFLVQGELMTLLGPGPVGRAGVSVLSTLLIPSTLVVFGAAAIIAARVRTATRQVALDGHVQTADSRGLPTTALVLRRVLQHTLPLLLAVLIVEFLVLYAGSLTVQSVFITPDLAANLPPLLPAESLPFVLGAVLLCIIGLIVLGIALGTNLWNPPEPYAVAATTTLPSRRFRSTDFLDIRDLTLRSGTAARSADAAAGISLTATRGQALAVVGAAGDDASLLCLAIAGLLPPGSPRLSGSILLDGTELIGLSERQFRQLRRSTIGFLSAPGDYGLDSGIRIGHQLARLMAAGPNGSRSRELADTEVSALLVAVGITDVPAVLRAYPRQLSAATVQRVLLAVAAARRPHLLIADHPTIHLDPTEEAEYLDVLHAVQRAQGFTLLLASGTIANVLRCDRVAVMHEGTIVEYASAQELITAPQHPYSRSLLAAAPSSPAPSTAAPLTAAPSSAAPSTAGPGSGSPAGHALGS